MSSSSTSNSETQASEAAPTVPTIRTTPSDPTSSMSKRLSARGRPLMAPRVSSGTIIVSRDSPPPEREEHYDKDDARAMSPRRSSADIEKMGENARKAMEEQAKMLQANLLEIVERVEAVKGEHEKLEGRNRFLQSYIGELMQTSKITSTGAAETKSKGKSKKGK